MTTFPHPARLTVYVCDSAMQRHKSLAEIVVQRAREASLAGATVLRGIEGFGRSGDIRTIRMVDVADHLPVAVVLVDDDERLRTFVRDNADVLAGRLVTLEPIELYDPQPAAGEQ